MSTATIEMEVGYGALSETEALAAVQRVIDEGRAEPERQQTKGMAPEHRMYWKISPNPRRAPLRNKAGWIVIGPSPRTHKSDAEVAQFARNKEATQLEEFGEYAGSAQRNPLCANWNAAHPYGPYTELFRQPGGARMMPISQHIAIGSHRRPEIVAMVPELAEVQDQPCPHKCTNDDGSLRMFVSQAAVNQHVEAIHKRDQGVIQGMEAVAQVLRDNQQTAAAIDPTQLATAVALALQMLQQPQAPVPPPLEWGTGEPPVWPQPGTSTWDGPVITTDSTNVEPPPAPAKSIDEMTRQELLAFISQNQIPIPDGRQPFSLKQEEARAIVRQFISGE